MLTISVIIPAYNYADYIGHTINSVLSQTYPIKEIIVVNDGSTDNTAEVLASYCDRIQVIYQKNQGLSAAKNVGANHATGDLLAFLDADDIWLPHKLERQVDRFIVEPNLGLVHCGLEIIDATGCVTDRQMNGLEGWVAQEMLKLSRPVILGGGSGAVIPRNTFLSVGDFDPGVSVSHDWDMYYRIARSQEVGFVPEVLLQYRVHGQNMHSNVQKMERDMLLCFSKAFGKENLSEISNLRRQAYGNLHRMLAGSFFQAKQPLSFMYHFLKSLWFTPNSFLYFLDFPRRWWQRQKLITGIR
ncbi:glycosyltransferase family 2 protein [Laspinema olomoucense]|uniref:Glycosyltransferase family 2 protein n=1 Tax=Laspinema olomoucense D3b TaxID=2953688 RepID=A0ABT2N1E8_9CYAN|nr:glycosyltransferase family 2 protein [Laspinema sp. D3b]MCT7976488.1 glycosyltransferase family 2 protein [Laspinema sp. D3b]